MDNQNFWVAAWFLLSVFFVVVYFIARRKMFENGELYSATPEYDIEKVKSKHAALRVIILVMSVLPFVLITIVNVFVDCYAIGKVSDILDVVGSQLTFPYLLMALIFVVRSIRNSHSFYAVLLDEPYILTRYMIYPRVTVSAGILTAIGLSCAGGIAGFVYSFFENNITIRNGMGFPFGVLCFILELALVYLANYAIIGWYDVTSNDFLFDKVSQEAYDKAAKRYYGIWRNRLILANVVAGAQLILGGFVTLTNAGEHLMGIRLLGLILLVAVFSYILIQSREFEDPVVVRGMVYPSEKKRVALKWVILSAIALYTLGAIILL